MSLKQKNVIIPKLKYFWQRTMFAFAISVILSIFIFWPLSETDLVALNQLGANIGRRKAAIRFMLNLMSPIHWGWFFFCLLIAAHFIGDWYYHRFENYIPEDPTTEV